MTAYASLAARPVETGLRIGLVTPGWPGTATPNGIATATAHLAAGLEANGHEVTIITHRIDGPHDHPRVVVLPDTPMPILDRLMYRISADRTLKRNMVNRLRAAARTAIKLHGVEVIVMEETRGWAGDLRRRLPVPVVVTLHGPAWLHRSTPGLKAGNYNAFREDWETAGLHQVDGIISPSKSVRDGTEAEWGLPALPCAVIGNPVGLAGQTAAAARELDPNLLFVGRFDWIKGGDIVVEAFARIAAVHPTCRLTFVGPDGGIRQPDGSVLSLNAAIARLPEKIRARIEVTGPKSRDEVQAMRDTRPITILASRFENFSIALLEAMAAGAPVVCTRVGGCGEILTDGRTGLLVPPEDPQALAAACLRLLADPALARQLADAARAEVPSRFAPEVIAREVAAFLATIVRR